MTEQDAEQEAAELNGDGETKWFAQRHSFGNWCVQPFTERHRKALAKAKSKGSKHEHERSTNARS